MRKISLILVSLFLAGCATQTQLGYQQALNSWVGGSANDLVNSNWGVPTRTFSMPNGNKVYCYTRSSLYQTQGFNSPMFYSGGFIGLGSGFNNSQIVSLVCDTCFFLDKKYQITKFTFQGNNCVATPKLQNTNI